MSKFNFKFENVLTLRKREEEKVILEMAPYTRKLNSITEQIGKLDQTLMEYSRDRLTLMREPGLQSVYTSMMRTSRELVKSAMVEQEQANKDLEKWRHKLVEAMSKRKAMEILKEKHHQKFLKVAQKKEELVIAEALAHSKFEMML